jgi:AraC family transcriptional regulator
MNHSNNDLTVPLLFLSSDDAWDNLLLLAYDEPMQMDGWIDPVMPDISLMLMLRGTMLLETNKILVARQGDWFLRPADSLGGEIRWQSLSPEPMQTLHLRLNQKVFARMSEEIGCSQLSIIGRSAFQDGLFSQIALALFEEAKNPSPMGKLYAQSAAQMLSSHLLRHYASSKLTIKPLQHGLSRRHLKQIKDYIEAHLSENVSLEDLAHLLDFSSYHFMRLFRQATGQSPYQFILERRVERAKALLQKTELPLAQVALESGFAHQSHLSRVFKQHLGLTPKSYRQKFKQ